MNRFSKSAVKGTDALTSCSLNPDFLAWKYHVPIEKFSTYLKVDCEYLFICHWTQFEIRCLGILNTCAVIQPRATPIALEIQKTLFFGRTVQRKSVLSKLCFLKMLSESFHYIIRVLGLVIFSIFLYHPWIYFFNPN